MKPVEKKESSSGKNAYPGALFNCAATLVLGKMFVFGGVQAQDETKGPNAHYWKQSDRL